MSDGKKPNAINDVVSKLKDAVNSDAVKNTAQVFKDKVNFDQLKKDVSNGNFKSYLTKKNIVIGIIVLFCIGAIGSFFEEENTNNSAVDTPKSVAAENAPPKYQEANDTKQKSTKDDLRGPKIFGLQLGMTKDEAYEALKGKYTLNVDNTSMKNSNSWYATKVANQKPSLLSFAISLDFLNNHLQRMVFKPWTFNASEFDADFMRAFTKKYKIKFSEDDIEVTENDSYDSYTNTYRVDIVEAIKNRKEGYQLQVEKTRLTISELEKLSDMKFE